MAFTQSDIDALDRAIASGALKVRYADGSEVTYRSLDEMERTRAKMVDRVAGGTPQSRSSLAVLSS